MLTMISEIEVSYEELKSIVLEALRIRPDTRLSSILSGVGSIAVESSIVASPHDGVVQGASYSLRPSDEERVIDIIWDLIIERVLNMGRPGVGGGWPFLKVSSYGREVLSSSSPIPHDPSGYLGRLRREVPEIDPIILIYMKESLRTYSIGAILSSTVTLGCASEKAFLLLIEALRNAIADTTRKANFEKKINARQIKRKFDALKNYLASNKDRLTNGIWDGLEVVLLGVFEMIRNNRNDAGHPTGKIVPREEAYASLQVFIPYCKKLYSLIDFLRSNSI